MKKLFQIIALVVVILGSSLTAYASWVPFHSKKYKISFLVPKDMKLYAGDYGKWGVISGKMGPIRLEAYGYNGVVSDKDAITFAIARTKIPMKYWKSNGKGKNWQGFTSFENYYVADKKDVLSASLLRTKERTYLIFVATPTAIYTKYKSDFDRFAKSFRALKSEWVPFSSTKYKIAFSVPRGMKMKAGDFGKWGVVSGKLGPIRLEVYGHKGVVSDKDVITFAIARTGVPLKYWKSNSKGKNWHGFTQFEHYYAADTKSILSASLLRTATHTYVVFVSTSVIAYLLYKRDFAVFANSFHALNSEWVNFSNKKYGISFVVPKDMKMKAGDFGKWGVVSGKLGPIRLEVYGYNGVVSDMDVVKFGVARTSVPAIYWKSNGKGKNWNGFSKFENFYVTDGKSVLSATLLRTKKRTYLVLVATTVAVYTLYKADFEVFSNNLKAL